MASALNKLSLQTMQKSKNLEKISKEELQEVKDKRQQIQLQFCQL